MDFPFENFYRALDHNEKEVANTITEGSFMDCIFFEETQRFERVEKMSSAWATRDTKMIKSSFSIGNNLKQVKFNQEVLYVLERVNDNIGLLMKQN